MHTTVILVLLESILSNTSHSSSLLQCCGVSSHDISLDLSIYSSPIAPAFDEVSSSDDSEGHSSDHDAESAHTDDITMDTVVTQAHDRGMSKIVL